MPTAIISDIHANLEALTTVLDDIDRRGITRILCLGDVVGYGPNPRDCIDLIKRRCRWTLMGNHDFAVLYEPTSFNLNAESAVFWTRQELESEPDSEDRRKRWEFLGNLRIGEHFDGALCVHASPRKPISEYIFPDDVATAPTKMAQIFEHCDARCFVGHTHVSGVFTDEPNFYSAADLNSVYDFRDDEKCIINPGSVGQPRDRDTRSSYVIVTDHQVEFVRLEYDIQAVVDKVNGIAELNDFLGARLLEGR